MAVRNPVQEFSDACDCFQPGDGTKFAHIVKRSFELEVITPQKVKDALGGGLDTIVGWADGSVRPLDFMQKRAVSLIRDRIGTHI